MDRLGTIGTGNEASMKETDRNEPTSCEVVASQMSVIVGASWLVLVLMTPGFPSGGCIIDGVRDDAQIFVAHRDPLAVGAVFGDTVRAGEHDAGAF
jgi:hypothetical protein